MSKKTGTALHVRAADDAPADEPPPIVDKLVEALSGLRFGEVRVIVQDGRVVQIERIEKQRLR